MEKILVTFESRFCDYTSLPGIENVRIDKNGKIDYGDHYVDDCEITATYLFDLCADESIKEDATISDIIRFLEDDVVIYFEYYMIDAEMHCLCFICDDDRVAVCQSYGGLTPASHEWFTKEEFKIIIGNFHNNNDLLVHIGHYDCEIDDICISKRKSLSDIKLPDINIDLEQRLYDARQCYINFRIKNNPLPSDIQYTVILRNNIHDYILSLHDRFTLLGYSVSDRYINYQPPTIDTSRLLYIYQPPNI